VKGKWQVRNPGSKPGHYRQASRWKFTGRSEYRGLSPEDLDWLDRFDLREIGGVGERSKERNHEHYATRQDVMNHPAGTLVLRRNLPVANPTDAIIEVLDNHRAYQAKRMRRVEKNRKSFRLMPTKRQEINEPPPKGEVHPKRTLKKGS
jgi:hypothetical protein